MSVLPAYVCMLCNVHGGQKRELNSFGTGDMHG